MQGQQESSLSKQEIYSDPFLSSLRQLQKSINEDIEKMSNLKQIYHENQQKKFLVTFVNIMDRMSNELQKANQMYDSIDKQIEQNQQCKHLSKELQFFQNECTSLRQTLREKQQILETEKTREILLRNQQKYLQKRLYQSTYKEIKYKTKLQLFELGRRKSVGDYPKNSRTLETRSKSMRLYQQPGKIDNNTTDLIRKSRPNTTNTSPTKTPRNSSAKTHLKFKKHQIVSSEFLLGQQLIGSRQNR